MKKIAVVSISALYLMVFPLNAQTSVIGKMEVEIATPVTAVETQLLNFGKVIPEAGGGTIRITASGERTSTGNVTLMDDDYSPGKFVVSGMPSSLVSIVLPQVPQKMVLANGSSEISVDNFISDVPVGGQVVRQEDGKAEVSIGATLFLGNSLSNPAGYYSGTFEVVFMYN
jgi:hypothetical protein